MADRARKCRFHCASCDRHFASERAFDWHRRGPWGDRVCKDPAADAKGRFAPADGICDLQVPEDDEPAAAEVWSV